jgi:hypothetical protein
VRARDLLNNTTIALFDVAANIGGMVGVVTLLNFADGKVSLPEDVLRDIVAFLQKQPNEEARKENAMSDEPSFVALARARMQTAAFQAPADDHETLEAFAKVSQLMQWAADLGLQVRLEDERYWVLLVPDPDSKKEKYVEVLKSSSLRDLTLILTTCVTYRETVIRKAVTAATTVKEEDKEADLVVPRVLDYDE